MKSSCSKSYRWCGAFFFKTHLCPSYWWTPQTQFGNYCLLLQHSTEKMRKGGATGKEFPKYFFHVVNLPEYFVCDSQQETPVSVQMAKEQEEGPLAPARWRSSCLFSLWLSLISSATYSNPCTFVLKILLGWHSLPQTATLTLSMPPQPLKRHRLWQFSTSSAYYCDLRQRSLSHNSCPYSCKAVFRHFNRTYLTDSTLFSSCGHQMNSQSLQLTATEQLSAPGRTASGFQTMVPGSLKLQTLN